MELAAGNGDRIQLFGPGHRYFEFYRSHGASIVPLLEVDDLDQASAELDLDGTCVPVAGAFMGARSHAGGYAGTGGAGGSR